MCPAWLQHPRQLVSHVVGTLPWERRYWGITGVGTLPWGRWQVPEHPWVLSPSQLPRGAVRQRDGPEHPPENP